jgi:peptidyl-prolyl cis-trans isomerase SurA
MRIRTLHALLLALVTGLTGGALAPTMPAQAQSLFSPAIKVNDKAITYFEIEQRARMLTLFRTPGNPEELARKQLIEDRLKLAAAEEVGLEVSEPVIRDAMDEFAARGDLTLDQMITALGEAGVDESSFRDFVRSGVTWRELVAARFASQVSVNEDDMERARMALSGSTGVRVLLSEIVLPIPQGQLQQVQQLADQISEFDSVSEFAKAARRFSAAPSAQNDGRMEWMNITDLPDALRPVVLGLSPGEVSEPLPTQQAIVLIQMRDIAEAATPPKRYEAIEYAAYYIPGGRSEQALSTAARVRAEVDVCDDLYGVAQGQPAERLVVESKAPNEIAQDIALQLSQLDPGESSTALTRRAADGQPMLMFLMLCGRTPAVEGEGPTEAQITGFIRNQRLESYGQGYLEQLRAEARIVEY